jgi:hypothetical protein
MTSFVCGVKKINLGLNPSGIAYTLPNNGLDFTLANLKYGVVNGQYMKSTPTGKKLPNPANTLARFLKKPPPSMSIRKVGPVSVNQYTTSRNVNSFNKARIRLLARRKLQARLRGKIAVSGNRKGILRELKLERKFATDPVQEVAFDHRANPGMTVSQLAAERRALEPPRQTSTAYDSYLRQYMQETFGYVNEDHLRPGTDTGDDEQKSDSGDRDEHKLDDEEKRGEDSIENPEEQ